MNEFPPQAQRYQDVHHCPRCAAAYRPADFDAGACLFLCAACGFAFYQNPVPAAVAVVVDPQQPGRVLLLRRRTPPNIGRWCFPGGFIGYGEAPAVAAAREAREEIGVEVEIGRLLHAGLVDYQFQGRQICVLELGYLAWPKQPMQAETIVSAEASEAAYFNAEDVLAAPQMLAFSEQSRLLLSLR